jgi:hypothetical protein
MAMHMATPVMILAALAVLGWGERTVGGRNEIYIETAGSGNSNSFPGPFWPVYFFSNFFIASVKSIYFPYMDALIVIDTIFSQWMYPHTLS